MVEDTAVLACADPTPDQAESPRIYLVATCDEDQWCECAACAEARDAAQAERERQRAEHEALDDDYRGESRVHGSAW